MSKAPDGWRRASLGEIGRWSGGGTPSKSNAAYWQKGSIPWLSPKDMKRARIEGATDQITENALEAIGGKLIPTGSLLFVVRSGILKHSLPMAANTVPVAINQDLKALTPVKDVDSTFLLYQLSSLQQELLRRTVRSGTTVESVNFENLKQFEVVIPPLAEQKRIAERLGGILAATANARAKLGKILSMLDAYRRAVVMQVLSGKLTEIWRRTRSISPVWQNVVLSQIADIQAGVTLGKKYGSASLVRRPYLRVANVQRGYLDLEDVKTIAVSETEAKRHLLLRGDILMTEGGDRDKLGRGWVWNKEVPGCIHQNHVFRVRLRDSLFPPEYISLYANELGRDHFVRQGTQTTNLASISKAKLGELPMRLPSPGEAREALKALETRTQWMDGIKRQVTAMLAALDGLDRLTARKAFEGRLVLSIAGEPPPSFVLDKVEVPRSGMAVRALRTAGIFAMDKITRELEQWPTEGLTFERLRELVSSDYESLKDAVFDLLGGPEPKLEQKYDDGRRVMRLFRVQS